MNSKKPLDYMFWQELDFKKTPDQVLKEAVMFATRKHGRTITVVRAPLSFPDLNGKTPEGVTIERHKDVAPTYLWVLIPDEVPPVQTAQPTEQVQDEN